MAPNRETGYFSPEEHQAISDVARGLNAADYHDEAVLASRFLEIIEVFEKTRSRIIEQLGSEDFATIAVEIDLSQTLPEVRFHFTTEPRNSLFRGLKRALKRPKTTEVLILTSSGYRIDWPLNIDNHRFHAGPAGVKRLRQTEYSRQSYGMINDFVGKLHKRFYQ
ncbi:hypothetical protein HY605_02625 [Candidatus Peregrinibacteria bacterium]|nr:hypothetical protein [Candidatus Peregrinibacteria bacterium]